MSYMREIFFLGKKVPRVKVKTRNSDESQQQIPALESCSKGAAVVPRLWMRLPSSCKAHTSICWLAATSVEPSRVSKLPSLIAASDRSIRINYATMLS